MSEQKEPFERLMLKTLKPKKYIRKMERIIVDEGKALINSLRINYRIVSNENIGKWLEKHPEFKKTNWKQLGFYKLCKNSEINKREKRLLTTMKQVLNKNNNYLLRGDQFELRKKVLNCSTYNVVKDLCYSKDCPNFIVCPKYYKNDNKYWSEQLSSRPATREETEHLLHCKGKHYWTTILPDTKEMLVCEDMRQIVDLTALHNEISKRLKEENNGIIT